MLAMGAKTSAPDPNLVSRQVRQPNTDVHRRDSRHDAIHGDKGNISMDACCIEDERSPYQAYIHTR